MEWITLPSFTNYHSSIEIVKARAEKLITNTISQEAIYLLEYDDLYSVGTSGDMSELLNASNVPIIFTDRGGKITYHGKGQRIIYPILNLALPNRAKDVKLYVSMLAQVIINVLARFYIKAFTIQNKVGVWVEYLNSYAKIAAIGIRIRKWVTYHGIAVNIDNDLSKYDGIIPCGISEYPNVSLATLGLHISFNEFDAILKEEFTTLFT